MLTNAKRLASRAVRHLIGEHPHVEARVTYTTPGCVLKGRAMLVTGGTRGIGRAIAARSMREGAAVVVVGRSGDSCSKVEADLGCETIVRDVADVASLEGIFAEAESLVGRPIDSLVSNAGISLHEGSFRNVTEDGWDAQMATNLKAGFFLCQEFVSYVESRGLEQATILVVTSERARRPDDIPYGLTKVASDSYIQALASKLIRRNIRINGIAPGVTCTDMTRRDPNGSLYNSWQNNGRLFLPEEVAEVANFLLSDASSCISGEIIACNQGNHIATW